MTIKILTSEKAAEYFQTCNLSGIKSVTTEQKLEDPAFYWVTITFEDYFSPDLIGATMFAAGISYGLDLQYSSYDNNVPR